MSDLRLSESREEKEAIVFWLLEHELKLSRAKIMAGEMILADVPHLYTLISRLNKNEPIQYVLGESEFYGRKYFVSPDVLIPRPETEQLVKEIVDRVSAKNISILDIGTGSGCIAISLALELNKANVFGTDVSPAALAVAEKNATILQASAQFSIHNILADELPLSNLDVVVSNPPYIPLSDKDTLSKNVSDFEPAMALFVDGQDPLMFYKAIANHAQRSLRKSGLLITEIHQSYGHETASVFLSAGFKNVSVIKDLFGKDRFVSGMKS
ncbi:MAG TPA: peptide chain release factor N(5)-glutamine methyltransferase [Cyclobacteriaceae bacterium]|nr:peptide chain release factor N(5)-glutamine methyltransferase [Cyclobacteriaceae bacterium]